MRLSPLRPAALGFVAIVSLCASRNARADAIPCPVPEATWGVTTPLPDPWQSTPQGGPVKEQVGAFINGKEWIICRYGGAEENDVFSRPSGYGAHQSQEVHVFRPALTNVPIEEVKCPATRIKTGPTTPVPAPWTSTAYVWRLGPKTPFEMAGQQFVRCTYVPERRDVWGAGPSALLRPLQPDEGPGLSANPKPRPAAPGDLASEFAVTEATLSTAPLTQAPCPFKIRFTGSIAANGKGDVVYRIVHNGSAGNPRKLDYGQAGRRPVVAEFTVGGPKRRGAAPSGGSAGAGSIAAGPADPNRHTGSARIEILKPQGGVLRSDDVNYAVECAPARPDAIKARQPTP